MGALIDRVENGEASMAHWKGKDGAQDLGDGFTLLEAKQSGDKIFTDSIFEGLEQVWTTGCGALEMDPSLLNTKHKGGVCGVWLGQRGSGFDPPSLQYVEMRMLRRTSHSRLLHPGLCGPHR